MYRMWQEIKEKFNLKAQLILTEKNMKIREYNAKCGRLKIKNILENNNLNRQQKEIQLKQLNGELNTEVNKEAIDQILTKLRDLQL